MNMTTFWTSLAIGAVIALLASWRFSRSGGHARFRPAIGVVGLVFLAIMGAVAFLSVILAKMVGNQGPPGLPAEVKAQLEATRKQQQLLQRVTPAPAIVPATPATEVPVAIPDSSITPPAKSTADVTPGSELDSLPEPAGSSEDEEVPEP